MFLIIIKKIIIKNKITESVQSHQDIDSIIIYCNKYDFFTHFVEALPETLLLSYYESIKNKHITESQVRFLVLVLQHFQLNDYLAHNIMNTIIQKGTINYPNAFYSNSNDIISLIINNEKLKDFILKEIEQCDSRRDNLYKILSYLLNNNKLEDEKANYAAKSFFSKLKLHYDQHENKEITTEECKVLRSILKNKNIKKEIKNQVADFFTLKKKSDNNRISNDYCWIFISILNSEDIEKEINNNLVDSIISMTPALLQASDKDKLSFQNELLWDVILHKDIENAKKKIFVNNICEILKCNVDKPDGIIFTNQFSLLFQILKNNDINIELKDRVFNFIIEILPALFEDHKIYILEKPQDYSLMQKVFFYENKDIDMEKKKKLQNAIIEIFKKKLEKNDNTIGEEGCILLKTIISSDYINSEVKKELLLFISQYTRRKIKRQ